MQPSDPISICRQVITAINLGDAGALDDLLTEHVVDHNPIPNQSPGRVGFKEWMTAARTSFPDLQGTIEDAMASGDRVAGRVTWRGTQRGPFAGLAPTNKPAALSVMHMVRLEGNKIAEWWGVADILGVVQQLGGKVVPG